MKLPLLVAAVLISIASVHGGTYHNKNPSWMLFPGEDGVPRLVILKGPVGQAPKAIDPINDVKFYLYTRSTRDNPNQIFVNDLQGAPFDGSKSTKFIVHGFTSNGFNPWAMSIKNLLLDIEDCNVISVDWEPAAQPPLYNVAKANSIEVGQYVGEMHNFLSSLGGTPDRTHCIGHSLGAHVCGISGQVNGGNLGRVTAMDPAMPLFDIGDPSGRLSDDDAYFVDVIHSCGGLLGFQSALGHIDFYPNDGTAPQPGCGLDLSGNCSHGRSHEFFIESIQSWNFRAVECPSWGDFTAGSCNGNTVGIMGYNVDTNSRGVFYLRTNADSPYAQG